MGLDAWKTVKNNGFGLIKTSSTAKSLNMYNIHLCITKVLITKLELKSRKRFGGKIEKDENKNGGLLSSKKKKVVFMP